MVAQIGYLQIMVWREFILPLLIWLSFACSAIYFSAIHTLFSIWNVFKTRHVVPMLLPDDDLNQLLLISGKLFDQNSLKLEIFSWTSGRDDLQEGD
jgi:hypothetical protein